MSIFNVLEFGAAGDGVHNDAPAIQKAIDACANSGGGRVLLPGGKTYLTASIELKSHVDLHISHGAVLKTAHDLALLCPPFLQEAFYQNTKLVFIYARGQTDIAISGTGIIDGNAEEFIDTRSEYLDTSSKDRPTTIMFENCSHCVFRDFTVRNASFWTLHPLGCYDVSVFGVRILNSLRLANCDGIDPDHCRQVRIAGCHIECADDCIVMKNSYGHEHYGDCENITITGCTLISASAAVKLGTDSVNDFKNIVVTNCAISASNRGIALMIRDKGNAENISFSDITIETRTFAPVFWGRGEPICITSVGRTKNAGSGSIRNVRFRNIFCTSENSLFIFADGVQKIKDVSFTDLSLTLKKTGEWPLGTKDLRPSGQWPDPFPAPCAAIWIRNAEGVSFHKTRVSVDANMKDQFRQSLFHENAPDLTFTEVCIR